MYKFHYVVILFIVGLMVGCAGNSTVKNAARMANEGAEKSGSSYRWVVEEHDSRTAIVDKQLIGTPAPTAADQVLKKDVLTAIEKLEVQSGATGQPKLIETRRVSIGSDAVTEVWVVSRDVKNVAYTVTMRPSPNGGVDLSISGPW